jgi:three-Cys-motif partner protein
VELFTGFGSYLCNGVDCTLEGSALRALKSRVKFSCYVFLAQSRAAINNLQPIVASFNSGQKVKLLFGNPNNEKTLSRVLDNIPRSTSSLALVDPGGYRHLHWSTLEKLAYHGKNWQGEKIDLLIIFPLEMAILRQLMRPECEESITLFYGSRQWEEIKRQKQVGKMNPDEAKIRLVELYKNGLLNLGYRYVDDFKPASPSYVPYYHLLYASDRESRLKRIKEAWGKPRFLRCELMFGIRRTS